MGPCWIGLARFSLELPQPSGLILQATIGPDRPNKAKREWLKGVCIWCLGSIRNGRCVSCGRTDQINPELLDRLAKRRQEGKKVPAHTFVRPRPDHTLPLIWPGPFQVVAVLILLAALFALIRSIFFSFMPMSWQAGCDICGAYTRRGSSCCNKAGKPGRG